MPLIKLGLNDGSEISISKIMLFPEDVLFQANSLKAQAIKKLGGVHSGVGVLGSPAWAIGGGLVIGALESMASNTLQKEGVILLQKAESIMWGMKDLGKLIEINEIQNIHIPNPQSWSKLFIKKLTGLDKKTRQELHALCEENKISINDVYGAGFFKDKIRPEIEIRKNYVFDGDSFLCVLQESEKKYIRWSDVSTYRVC